MIKTGSEMKLEQMFIDFPWVITLFFRRLLYMATPLGSIKSHLHQTFPAKTHRKPLRLPVLLPHFRRKATWTRSANFETRRHAGGTSSETSETKSAQNKGKKDVGTKNEEVPMLFCMFFSKLGGSHMGFWRYPCDNDPMSWLNMMEKKPPIREE